MHKVETNSTLIYATSTLIQHLVDTNSTLIYTNSTLIYTKTTLIYTNSTLIYTNLEGSASEPFWSFFHEKCIARRKSLPNDVSRLYICKKTMKEQRNSAGTAHVGSSFLCFVLHWSLELFFYTKFTLIRK